MNSQASPATATHVTGLNHYALLTTVTLMGATERAMLCIPCMETRWWCTRAPIWAVPAQPGGGAAEIRPPRGGGPVLGRVPWIFVGGSCSSVWCLTG